MDWWIVVLGAISILLLISLIMAIACLADEKRANRRLDKRYIEMAGRYNALSTATKKEAVGADRYKITDKKEAI